MGLQTFTGYGLQSIDWPAILYELWAANINRSANFYELWAPNINGSTTFCELWAVNINGTANMDYELRYQWACKYF